MRLEPAAPQPRVKHSNTVPQMNNNGRKSRMFVSGSIINNVATEYSNWKATVVHCAQLY